jgi:3-hydroxybutyryl-CoA dehydrogenase
MIGIVGAGAMGGGIAQVAAAAGERVLVYDAVPAASTEAVERIADRIRRDVSKGRVSAEQTAATLSRLRAVDDIRDLANADLVVEAVVESLEVKQALFADLERVCRTDAVLATNTSTLSVTDVATGLTHPERVCGMHFFNPAPLMRLVEVPAGALTEPAVADRVVKTAEAWGKTAVRCSSTPGFIVNRVARPYYGEAQRIAEEGLASYAEIDTAMMTAGFKMGPFALADLIGNDVNLASANSVWEQTGRDPRYEPTPSQRALVEAGNLGRKTGRGWFRYEPPEPTDADVEPALATRIQQRIVAMLVNEAAALVDRGEASPDDVDTAMRLGTNYPFGPLERGDEWGPSAVLDVLTALDAEHPGGRYRPAERLVRAARTGGSLRG